MTKGTIAYRTIIGVLLALVILWTVFITFGLFVLGTRFIHQDDYNLYVAGELVTRENKHDILGDGKVSYNASQNTLTFDNAVIDADCSIVFATDDLTIELIGENKFICKDMDSITAIYVADGWLRKDLSFQGDGSLIVEYQNVTDSVYGIVAEDIRIGTDLTFRAPDCTSVANGIVSTASLTVRNQANVAINLGTAKSISAVSVLGNTLIEDGSALHVNINGGSSEACSGMSIMGDLFVGGNAVLEVAIDDAMAYRSECITVSGLMSIGRKTTLNAKAAKAYAIECNSSIELNKGAVVTAETDREDADIFCYGVLVNYEAEVNAEMDVLGGIYNRIRE